MTTASIRKTNPAKRVATKVVDKSKSGRALIYTRVSDDKTGVARSPEEQEAEARAWCKRHGHDVARVICDNSVGASRYSKGVRHGFAALKTALSHGDVDIVVAWEASRFARDLAAYAALAELCRETSVLYAYSGKVLDLDDPDDEFVGGLDALLAQRESGVIRKRVTRAMRANAAAGRPHGRVQFGYVREYDKHTGQLVGQVPDPEKAGVVRYIFEQLAAGVGTIAVADALNAQGWTTQSGKPWVAQRVRQLVVDNGVSYLGHRVYQGEVAVENAWPAIVDQKTYDVAVAFLLSKSMGSARPARWLLSGILTCGECGGAINVDPRSYENGGKGRPTYVCRGSAGSAVRGCVSRKVCDVDAGVTAAVRTYLAQPGLMARITGAQSSTLGAAVSQLEALRSRLREAEEAMLDGVLSARAFGALEARLAPQLDELEAQQRDATVSVPSELVQLASASDAVAAFDALDDVAARRTVIRALFDELVLARSAFPRGHKNRREIGVEYRWVGSQTTEKLTTLDG